MRADLLSESLYSEDALEKCRSYLVAQVKDREARLLGRHRQVPGPAITISREAGCGASEVLDHLADLLQKDGPNGPSAWTVFDRQLVEKILEEHNLPKLMAKFITEDRRTYLRDRVEEVLWLRPPPWQIVPQSIETILHLVEMGHVIIVGRGSNVITTQTPNVFHVRLVAPLAQRVEYAAQAKKLSPKEAAKWVKKLDRQRALYVQTNFQSRIDNPLLYHAVINTGRMSYPDAAQLIADGARRHFQRETGNAP
jgi:hypothetical protein